LRCLDRKAAARFLTSRASRLDRPVTSGGTKSLVLIGPDGAARGFFAGRTGEGEREREQTEELEENCLVGCRADGR
jgi:hypothetical protein